MRPFAISIGGALLMTFCVTVQARPQLTDAPSSCRGLRAAACYPATCAVFDDGSCVPHEGAPIGRTPRVTMAASEETAKDKPLKDRRDEGQLVNTLHDMFQALRACWMPPRPIDSRPGMEYTIKFAFKSNGELIGPVRVTYATHGVPDDVRNVYQQAVEAAMRRCTPMHFSTGMAGAIAGRPIAVRFIDDRIMIEHFKDSDQGTNSNGLHSLPAEDGKPK